ncbi:MAG: hypothetical protein A2728_01735 [Candidatus Spechtbacteria bacterium RIFCSPHIGHO2_01_FULL_38_11]|nr:MAG: hypothetical protein A2728_01735 [Candidatus Spechtbacteria bacterium RIFCSPHIGHO2_01_FULL_38_11]
MYAMIKMRVRKNMQPSPIKNKAIEYRKKGYSYNMISEKLDLPKSTLSDWLKDIPFRPNQEVINRIGNAKLKSAQTKNRQKIENIKKMKKIAFKEVDKLSNRDLFMLGIGLYWGEGTKRYSHIRIINSDPAIIQASVRWFKDICKLKNKNFSIRVHIYPDNYEKECLRYWSNIAGISLNNFGKTQIDRRKNKSFKKRGTLPYGTAHLEIRSRGKKEFGVELHRRIMGWIEAVSKQI